jgi:hypothetical protein
VIQADRLVAQLGSGQRVDLEGVVVEGTLDLRQVGAIRVPVRCQRCTVRGGIEATDVVFERLVDLTGSTVGGPLEMRGSVFREAAVFDETTFAGDVSLGSARFLDGGSFSGATFGGQTSFESARIVRTADFSESEFSQFVTFARAELEGKADFASTIFAGEAHFEGCNLYAGGSFRVARFGRGAFFQRLSAVQSLDFTGAEFEVDAHMSYIVSHGTVTLEALEFAGDHRECDEEPGGKEAPAIHEQPISACLYFNDASVERLRMEVASISVVRGRHIKKEVLRTIERSAEASDDLGVANDARFQRLSMEGEEKTGLARRVDRVLYRGVAGYFIKPAHPLVAFLLLLLVASLVRGIPGLASEAASWRRGHDERGSRGSSGGIAGRVHGVVLKTEKAGAALLRGLAASFTVAVRPKPGATLGNPDRVRSYLAAGVAWLEFLGYKALFAVFLVALGNSNSTVRQIFDAVVS